MPQDIKNFRLNIIFDGNKHQFDVDESLTIKNIKELIEEQVLAGINRKQYLVHTNKDEIVNIDDSISFFVSNSKLYNDIIEFGNVELIVKLNNNDNSTDRHSKGKLDSHEISESISADELKSNDRDFINENSSSSMNLSRRRKISRAVNFGSRLDINSYYSNCKYNSEQSKFCESILDNDIISNDEYKIKFFELQKELDKQESISSKNDIEQKSLETKNSTKKKNSSKSKKSKKETKKSKIKKSKSVSLKTKEINETTSDENNILQKDDVYHKMRSETVCSTQKLDTTLNLNLINNTDDEESSLSSLSPLSTPRSEQDDMDHLSTRSKRREFSQSKYIGSFSVLYQNEYYRDYDDISDDISDSLSSDVDISDIDRKSGISKTESAPSTPKCSKSGQVSLRDGLSRRATHSDIHRKGTIIGNKKKFRRAKKVGKDGAMKRINYNKCVIDDIELKQFKLTPLQSELRWTSVSKYKVYRPTVEQELQDKKPVIGIQKMSMMRQAIFYESSPHDIVQKNKAMILELEPERLRENPIYIVFHLSETKYNVLLQCKLGDTLQDLKEIAFQKLESKIPESDNCLKLIDEYVLEWADSKVFLTDESTSLKDLPIFLTGIKIEHITLTERVQYELHKLKIKMINNLINAPYWNSTLESDIDEKTYFRKNIMRNTFIKARKTFQIPQMTRAPIPPYIPPKFKISFMIAPGISKAVGASPNSLISDIIEDAKKKLSLPKDKAYVMKICGQREYIIDREVQISKFEYIRKSLERKRGIYFQLIPIEELGCIEDPVTKNIIPPWQQQANILNEDNKERSNYEQDLDLAIIMSEINDDIEFERPKETIKRLKTRMDEYIFQESPPLLNTDSLWLQRRYFEVKIYQIRNLVLGSSANSLNFTNVSFYVEVGLYYGGEPLIESKTTNGIPWEMPLVWDEIIVFDRLCLRNLPLETRICFTLYGKDRHSTLPLANVSLKLFDHHNLLITGKQDAYMWIDDYANPIGFCGSNLHAKEREQNVLELMFDETPFPVKYTEESEIPDLISSNQEPTKENEMEMIKLLGMDSLWFPSPSEKKLLWKFRYWILNNYPKSLSKLALCVPWTNPIHLKEFWKLLDLWPVIEPKYALELLDARYADFRLRKFVVRSLQVLTDQELSLYLLQLVQVLKYELYHYTPLALFLVERALENEIAIGVPLFWFLKSELHSQENSERFGLILETLLIQCSDEFREEISKQINVVNQLYECAVKVKTVPENKRNAVLQKMLSDIELPNNFTLPLDPVKELGKIDVSKCRCFDSAKAPILISFISADPLWEEKYSVIFKEGDDLRQDALTLQLLTLMDQIWKMSNLDLHMTPYKVSITGYNTGLIEVVPDSKTTAGIQKESGITLAAFSEKPLRNWFEEKSSTQSEFMSIVDNFVLSCAGYCVLTYVLGIGDRHNSNIMVDTKGHLFHIDFGHFLGNYKSWKGIWDREKAPFVLTPEFAHVMDGKDSDNFKYFIRQCVRAYNIVRKEGNFILTLFTMMLSTGIPELKSAADLLYLRDSLSQDLLDEEAQDKFIHLIEQSLKCKTTQLNGFFHLLAH